MDGWGEAKNNNNTKYKECPPKEGAPAPIPVGGGLVVSARPCPGCPIGRWKGGRRAGASKQGGEGRARSPPAGRPIGRSAGRHVGLAVPAGEAGAGG